MCRRSEGKGRDAREDSAQVPRVHGSSPFVKRTGFDRSPGPSGFPLRHNSDNAYSYRTDTTRVNKKITREVDCVWQGFQTHNKIYIITVQLPARSLRDFAIDPLKALLIGTLIPRGATARTRGWGVFNRLLGRGRRARLRNADRGRQPRSVTVMYSAGAR